MRDFVKVSPTFWTGRTGRVLRKAGPDVQLTALYLLTCPHSNYIGLFILPIEYITADTGLPVDRVHQALGSIEDSGFARYDRESETVWLVEGAKWQLGELKEAANGKKADNRVAMVRKDFAAMPSDCPFLEDFKVKYELALKLTPGAEPVSDKTRSTWSGGNDYTSDDDPYDI